MLMTSTIAPAAERSARGAVLSPAYPIRASGPTRVSETWALPELKVEPEQAPTETLADALDSAYRSNPSLQIGRYQLRSLDEDYAQALSEVRPTSQIQIDSGYLRQVPAEQNSIFGNNRSVIHSNSLNGQLVVDQPLYTGGKASADTAAAVGEIRAGRAQLRSIEGDLFLHIVAAYVDIRRDVRVLALRSANLKQLQATLDEVIARREAGELTRTDIAQAETQLEAARAQANAAEQQLEQDRTSFADLVGHGPGVLAPEPPLPGLPQSADAALELAQRLNPDLAQAIEAERASRARIAASKSEGRPTVSIRGTASFDGAADPFRLRRDNRDLSARAVLTIPLTNGGRVASLVAQARDRNDADRIRIEQARRALVHALVDAWNGLATAERNVQVQKAQLESSRVLDEGTFEEYRAGLRSTFDVLFAHSALRDAEIALVNSEHDLYLAEATILRQAGLLEARTLLVSTPLYDPARNTRHAARRGAVPWEGLVRAVDRAAMPPSSQDMLVQPPQAATTARLAPAAPVPGAPLVRNLPSLPMPGTVGVPERSGTER